MPTSARTERSRTRDSRAGFALIELMLALAILSLLAALALPSVRPGTGVGFERAASRQAAAFLRAERNEALRSGRTTATLVDLPGRRLRSVSTGAEMVLSAPASTQPRGLAGFEFYPDGRASGGTLLLGGADGSAQRIHVNPLTAAVSLEQGAVR